MMTLEISVVLGSFISLLLMVNAFFVKELVKSINEVKLELAKLVTQHDNTSDTVKVHAEDIKELYKNLNNIREKINKIEGRVNGIQ